MAAITQQISKLSIFGANEKSAKNKEEEARKKKIKEIVQRQKKIMKEEIVQNWKILFGEYDSQPAKVKPYVITEITLRNIWMEHMFIFNKIKSLRVDENFHAPDVYALKWQPPGSFFQLMIPLDNPQIQENVILIMSKFQKYEQDRTIFYFAPKNPLTPMFAPHVHPASLVSYRTKNEVLKKLSDLFIEGRLTVSEVNQIFICGSEVWNSALYNLLPEDEQVFHTYLNEKPPIVLSHKAISKSYLEGDISLKEYEDLKFPDRKKRRDIESAEYPLPYEGEICVICHIDKIGVIKCQNCANMVCIPCMLTTFNCEGVPINRGERGDNNNNNDNNSINNNNNSDDNMGSFLLMHHKYCMKLGKLDEISMIVAEEPAYLREFRTKTRLAALEKLTPKIELVSEDKLIFNDEIDEEELEYRREQEERAKRKAEEQERKLLAENPPILREYRQFFEEKKKKYGKYEKEIMDYNEKISDNSHTEQFIARNTRLKNESYEKLLKNINDPLSTLLEDVSKLQLEGPYQPALIRDINVILQNIILLATVPKSAAPASSKLSIRQQQQQHQLHEPVIRSNKNSIALSSLDELS